MSPLIEVMTGALLIAGFFTLTLVNTHLIRELVK
jgi:hypothetical protein